MIRLRKTSIKPADYFNAEIETNNSKFKVDTFVVKDNTISFDLIVGTHIIHQETLIKMCSKTGVVSSYFLVNIVNVLDEAKMDLNRITDKKLCSELSSLIENYVPSKMKIVDVKTKIYLSDEILICSSP